MGSEMCIRDRPEGLPILAYSRRADPRDVLVLPEGADRLDPEKPLGSSSPRRALQLGGLFPGMRVESVRGNIQTRLSKMDGGQFSALVLAYSGILRLGLENRVSRVFSTDEMLPAAGQGILALQGRAEEDASFLSCADDENSRAAGLAERAFVRALDGGCSSPIAAYAELHGQELRLTGLYCREADGSHTVEHMTGSRTDAEKLGVLLAERMRRRV